MIQKEKLQGLRPLPPANWYYYIARNLKANNGPINKYYNLLLLERGKVYSFVPEGTSQKSIYEFENGGLYFFDKEKFNRGLITMSEIY